MRNSKSKIKTGTKNSGKVLPFQPVPTASIAGPTLAKSKHVRRPQPDYLPEDAPNVLIILMDDVGFGQTDTFGGEVHTPALTKLRNEGIAYNTFHTTSICSPTRASLLTGRNHTRVHSGTIAERALDFDGYTGVIPFTSATVAEVLKEYGYKTAAFGKWHNTPADQTTSMGPFDRWPTGHGFDHFYGFLAGETSQYEPRLVENINQIEPPEIEDYHLSEDIADKALEWLKKHRAFSPDKPFFMYWAPGACHGPHHIPKKWADKYKGKFNDGWDKYRERVFKRQKELGWIPKDTVLTERHETMAAWDDIPENQKAFQRRLMEVFAGFGEHADIQAGRLIDGIEEMGLKDNTLIFYIWGDNGSSAEGQNGSISELLAQNQIPNTIEQQLETLEELGGLDALGSSKTDNMYHASWAWAGTVPFKYTKLIASHFGGTRNPMVVSWPKKIRHDKKPRGQFHHVNDIAPTIYDAIGITHPEVVNGFKQDPLDGVSMKYTFDSADAKGKKETQFFDNNGSRGIYHKGWFACTFGPLYPWLNHSPGIETWDSEKDVWELYDLTKDFSQANDLASKYPEKVKELKKIFMKEAKNNLDLPIGAGIWTRLHPEDVLTSPYRSWTFDDTTVRMPEFTAPGIGKKSNKVVIDLETGNNSSGVLYALGGFSGGLSLFMDKGKLIYEYNMMMIERYIGESKSKLSKGNHKIEVVTKLKKGPGSAADVSINIDGKKAFAVDVKRTVPGAFTASESFDVGVDLGSPVSARYFDRAPFKFDGKIKNVKVNLI
ncbi:MAG: arylsulfatase [Ignavibacteriae bacterium]|nr:arylsulfatase [Ignavibacteriota bacterium]